MGCDEIEAGACPGFEGFEKRLEIEFTCCERAEQSGDGDGVKVKEKEEKKKKKEKRWLRSLEVSALEEILSAAQCSIVSGLSNSDLDSYVLSESSLFVYPLKIIIKTCGTTQLLNAISPLLSHASGLSLRVSGCRYSRGAFLFPQAQSFPHTDFREEVLFLDNYFGALGSKSYKLMNGAWHIYSAQAKTLPIPSSPSSSSYTLEVCMTEIDASFASLFFKENGLESAREMSVSSGIAKILEGFEVCDYAFDPCGYSMNAIGGDTSAYSTIHITPEENCSYASFEIMETTTRMDRLKALTFKIASSFRPGTLSFSLYRPTHEHEEQGSKALHFHLSGYECTEPIHKTLPGGGLLVFFSFSRIAQSV